MDYSQLKGAERIEAMKRLRHIHNMTTPEIGRLFRVTRERVRQLIGNTGRGFVTRRRKQVWEQNKHKTNTELAEALGISDSSNSFARYREGERHAIEGGGLSINHDHVLYVSNLLKSKGIEHELTKLRHPYDIHTKNGLRLEVLSASQLTLPNIYTPCYSFNTRQDKKGRFCDFFICVMSDTLNVFVIPAMKTRTNSPIRFCFPKDHGRISKWVQYHNRFDLLDKK